MADNVRLYHSSNRRAAYFISIRTTTSIRGKNKTTTKRFFKATVNIFRQNLYCRACTNVRGIYAAKGSKRTCYSPGCVVQSLWACMELEWLYFLWKHSFRSENSSVFVNLLIGCYFRCWRLRFRSLLFWGSCLYKEIVNIRKHSLCHKLLYKNSSVFNYY